MGLGECVPHAVPVRAITDNIEMKLDPGGSELTGDFGKHHHRF